MSGDWRAEDEEYGELEGDDAHDDCARASCVNRIQTTRRARGVAKHMGEGARNERSRPPPSSTDLLTWDVSSQHGGFMNPEMMTVNQDFAAFRRIWSSNRIKVQPWH